MAWKIEFDPRAARLLKELDGAVQREITWYLHDRVASAGNPRNFGKGLRDNLVGLWRYRVRNYRVICRIQDERLVILVVEVGHRSRVYRRH